MPPDAMADLAGVAFPECEAPEVSILIVAGNARAIARCLRAIHAHDPDVAFEIIVVDDAAVGLEALSGVAGLRCHRNETQLGHVRSLDVAARLARGRFLHVLGEEVEVTAGWLDALMALMVHFPACGIAGPRVLSPDGTLQQAGVVVWDDGSRMDHGRGELSEAPAFNHVRESDSCSGSAFLLRKASDADGILFDETYPVLEDAVADLSFRYRERGSKTLYCPSASVIRHPVDERGDVRAMIHSETAFRERWRHVLAQRHYPPGECLFRAREHGRHKRILLVIDHYLPQPDRDAGSRAILQTMQQLIAMGFLVKFWSANQYYDPSYRHLLEDAGIETVTGDRWANRFERYLRYAGQELDYVLLSRPTVAVDYVAALRGHSRARLLFYGHDLHHQRMSGQAETTGSQHESAAADAMWRSELRIWHDVDAVIYPSQEEADVAAGHIGIRKAHAVPLYCFDDIEPVLPGQASAGKRLLFVAGFGHSPNVDAAEWLVHAILPEVRKRVPDITLDLVGSNPNPRVIALGQTPGVHVSGNVSVDELDAYYRQATVAVVPLRFGAGVKLKVLEAMVRGIPVVTTSIGAQGLPGAAELICVADDVQGLVAGIVALATQPQRNRADLDASRAYVAGHYSSERMRDALWRVLADA